MTYIRSDYKAQAFLDYLENNGIGDEDFRIGILTQLSRLSHCGFSDKGFYLSVVMGSKPKNPLEVMTLVQLCAVSDQTFAATERLESARNLEDKDLCTNTLTKLMRMSSNLSEAFQRRNDKSITVQSVSVSNGGQAIVGTITHNAGQSDKGVIPLAITDAHSTAMPIIRSEEQLATAVPIAQPNERRASRTRRRRRA